jgi:hypothetical protein
MHNVLSHYECFSKDSASFEVKINYFGTNNCTTFPYACHYHVLFLFSRR